jgi:two-component system cell cycle sensor histidine kinase/response regulator CckA
MGVPLLHTRAMNPSDLRVLETMESSATRGAALVRQILSFSHGAGGGQVIVQTRHLLNDVAMLVRQTFPKSIRLEEDAPASLRPVQGNPTQLHQVLLNLCVNARDAMPEGGVLRLRAENWTIDAVQAGRQPGAHPGEYLMIEVSDTGTGIAPEIIGRIWEPFFTTKGEGKGTGLGLATVRGIAASHDGFVTLNSTPGRGTTFRVFLPAAEPAGTTDAGGSPAPGPLVRGRGELVLVVDDEPNVRDLVTAILSRFGYRVLAADGGSSAMALFAPRAEEVALVITDLGMPGMSGAKLAQALRHVQPGVPLLFISGGSVPGRIEPPPPGALVLNKPFTGEELLQQVRLALGAPPAA